MKEAIKDYEKYFQLGRKAFITGIRCAPVNDPEYMAGYKSEWLGARIGDEKSRMANEAAKVWIGGWTMENLKA